MQKQFGTPREIMKEKSFEGATQDEAERRAADWIKTQRGINVTRAIGTSAGSAKPPTAISIDGWTVVVEYEDGPRKAASTDWTADRLSRFFLLRIG
jgi:hypothetical protein